MCLSVETADESIGVQAFVLRKFGKRLEYSAEAAYGFSENFSLALKYFSSHNQGKNQEDYALELRWDY